MKNQGNLENSFKQIRHLTVFIVCVFLALASILILILIDPNLFFTTKNKNEYTVISKDNEPNLDKIENGIHISTGLVDDEGLMLVINNCTNCHSAKLVTQNRMSKERWIATIRWMQKTQNLWDLGEKEATIVNYLATNYAPLKKGRRKNLTDIKWYTLENQ